MNLRKKKVPFNYQDSQFLSKNYEYEELTKGKHRQQIIAEAEKKQTQKPKKEDKPSEEDHKDYTLIFAQLMSSIRRNMGQSNNENGEQPQQEQEEESLNRLNNGKLIRQMKTEPNRQMRNRKMKQKQIKVSDKVQNSNDVQPDLQQVDQFQSHPQKLRNLIKNSSAQQNRQKQLISDVKSNVSLHKQKYNNNTRISSKKAEHSQNMNHISQPYQTYSSQLQQNKKPLKQYKITPADTLISQSFPYVNFPFYKQSRPISNNYFKKDTKLFNRSSYHIAIAYHIHFKKNEFYCDPLEIDPTYRAKKMMQNINLQNCNI